ncbi:MAG: hypothetical protein U0350_04520 [Caldilineaceae bacterium]
MEKKLKAALAHVLWIGGGTDAGKTTVAEAIVERYQLQFYHFDRHEHSHIERRIVAGDYVGRKNLFEMTPDELWIDQLPEEMARGTIQGWSRRVDFVVDDLLAMPKQPLIVAEGPGFFPEVIQPLLSSPQQAIWLVPEPQFKRKIAIQRGKPSVRHETRDPALATENIIARDLLMAQHVRTEATRLGLTLIEVDGAQSIEQLIERVEQHFAPFLQARSTEKE